MEYCLMPGPQPVSDAHITETDPLLGRTLNDRYRIVEQIGSGGMGRVYKAMQAPPDRLGALQVLGAGHDRDPNFYKRFFLEASVTAKLTHPNTITLYDYGRTDDGVFYIAMEFLHGRTLSGHAAGRHASAGSGHPHRPADLPQPAGGPRARHHPPRPQAGQRHAAA